MENNNASAGGGLGVTYWGMEHKTADGRLICRQIIVQPPQMGPCLVLTCLSKYVKYQFIYVMTLMYHQHRVEYAEAFRDKEIPIKYRTGEDVPETFWKLFFETIKIPVVKKKAK